MAVLGGASPTSGPDGEREMLDFETDAETGPWESRGGMSILCLWAGWRTVAECLKTSHPHFCNVHVSLLVKRLSISLALDSGLAYDLL